MSRAVELPLIAPLYATYHYQGTATAILAKNPTIRNWYLNEAVSPLCNTHFLTEPVQTCIRVENGSVGGNRYFDITRIPTAHLGGGIPALIRALLDDGYYVWFEGVDDYYVQGKSLYHKQHFSHDGLICGYDDDRDTYRLYAYDEHWVYRTFDTPQKAFAAGQDAMLAKGVCRPLCGIRPRTAQVRLNPRRIGERLEDYLTVSVRPAAKPAETLCCGIAVQGLMKRYLDNIESGAHPLDRLDHRVFRMIWEHKAVMQTRLRAVEEKLSLGERFSVRYAPVAAIANDLRLMFASYCLKPRQMLLPLMREKLDALTSAEQEILPPVIHTIKEATKS